MYATYALSMTYYGFALFLAVSNISRHIIGEKRYKESGSFLALFYLFSVAVIIPRIAQLSSQMFLSESINYIVTVYLAIFIGMQLNAVILVMAFMMYELKTMISVPNVNRANEFRKRRLWLVLILIFVTSIPIYVCYFMPQYREKPP